MATVANPTRDDFAALLNESLGGENEAFEGRVVIGTVTGIENDLAVIDVGLKSEGRVPLREFAAPGQKAELKVGDQVEVYVDRVENSQGEAMLSRDRARREAAWDKLEGEFAEEKRVEGVIFGRVKGGFTVDLGGAVAFLPGSQVDIRPVRDVQPLMDIPQPFQILKMDRRRGNIVVSRRAILEETRAEQRSGLIQSLAEGQIIEGVVKNITDYGAFVDLGGIDGLLHVTDISYKRVNHPSEVLNIGDTVKVQIIRINRDTQRISLGMKQLESDPWEGATAKYPVGGVFQGRVTNITEYGAFVELEPGIEGLVHVSEMSWTKKNVHPGKIVSTSQEVDVKVLEVDGEKRRISLGLKQAQTNPWNDFAEKHPVGSQVEGEVKNATEFGLFIGLDGDVDGMVHMSDIAWGVSGEEALQLHRKGETVQAVVLDVDVEKERISLGMKQLERGGVAAGGATGGDGARKGEVKTVTVLEVMDGGLTVQVGEDGPTGFIKRSDLGRDRDEQRPERFQVGQKFDAMVTGTDRSKKPTFSIKAMQIAEEKQAVAQYGSSDSGASLGDILGAALERANKK
ncbi:30S ribosomal protein S1 [Sphingomonas astaxanthinifaciens]|uniref:30S ribosomal protein S1 n=1 Tax=Sphingomonas astaxanthinifaciens DSM 22298 TaxID=1123267 RepID=A0ABQ5Z375_9SPHN|nr:30S ribosomal protein S1 [Sphingomonas astaxanthinifaciens]GLR47230.1 30S ribosomal protein S1 [Sphingomonas astaxanthinifaciens DSM 22298]